MTTHSEITEQILSAWDEAVEEEPSEETETETETEVEVVAEEETETEASEEEVEQPAEEPAVEEEEEAPAEGEESPVEAEEEEPEVEAISEDPAVQAFLAKYQGDVTRALAGASALEKAYGRQGQDKAVLSRRVQELEAELAQTNALQGAQAFLTSEQHAWVEEATGSENPAAYVRQALVEGEFSLARAVCDEWAKEAPYEAIRASQIVDQSEQAAYAQHVETQQPGLPPEMLMDVLVQSFPDMPNYEQQMVSTLATLGDEHPIVIDSRSSDPQTAARGIVGLYEIARASSVTVKGAREQVKQRQRDAGNGARAAAQVSSSQASPSTGETPRGQTRLMPGLTLEQLDEAFENDAR